MTYDLTVSAGDCRAIDNSQLSRTADTTLPVDAKTRRYVAAVAPLNQSDLSVDVSGSNLSPFGFALMRTGARVHFTIDGPAFVERLSNFRYLEIFGSAETTVEDWNAAEISIPFDGSFEYCELTSERRRDANCFTTPAGQRIAYSICQSSTHRLTLRRQ